MEENEVQKQAELVVKKCERNEREQKVSGQKAYVLMTALGAILAAGGIACALVAGFAIKPKQTVLDFPTIPSKTSEEKTYSLLTGEELSDPALVNAATYCIQTPNGTDGGRPQAGLNQAGVVFEAIAEAGITRFAAIYQNPTSAVIGPIRSLRIYYLQWDTPFDCTIVHAGGAADALAAVKAGGYKDLTENYTYMYRGTYTNRLWNNLFTTAKDLEQFSSEKSNLQGFARMTPEEAKREQVENTATNKLNIIQPAEGDTSAQQAKVGQIGISFASTANYNVKYTYDAASNTYLRGYESGMKHEVYVCPDGDLGEVNPEDRCTLTQIAPSVVVAMVVEEKRAADNYHEDIKTTGSGKVYVFQNGDVIEGTWSKNSVKEQIKFTDASGQEIKLAPGQTFISAVPKYGSVDF